MEKLFWKTVKKQNRDPILQNYYPLNGFLTPGLENDTLPLNQVSLPGPVLPRPAKRQKFYVK
eukprot:3645847-Amphidinium_carterae.1